MGYKIAVVGATGNVGRIIFDKLHERNFPVDNIYALASQNSVEKYISFGNEKIKSQLLDEFDFTKVDISLFSAGSAISKDFGMVAVNKGCFVIDNSSFFRLNTNIPLIVPEVNGSIIEHKIISPKTFLIANPNCCVIPLVVALKPLHDLYKIKRIVISTYQSVSGAGKAAMDELYDQSKMKFFHLSYEPKVLPRKIAFDIIPQIGDFLVDGYTTEERKIELEIQKILDKSVVTSVTCVRVPVFIGHSQSVNVEFETKFHLEDIYNVLDSAKGVMFLDSYDDYIVPSECVDKSDVYVSRVRLDNSNPNTVNMWIVSDNLRKGAALNAVQIAEKLIEPKH